MKEIFKKSLTIVIIIITIVILYFTYKIINEEIQEVKNEPNQMRTYAEVYNTIVSTAKREGAFFRTFDQTIAECDDLSENEVSYSNTNLQVIGVQEADIIKTDGQYIYAINNEYLYIVKAQNGTLEITATINHQELGADNKTFFEMYIYEDRLIALQRTYSVWIQEDFTSFQSSEVGVIVFDISNKEEPQILNELSQSGDYLSSRMINNQLYLISNYFVYENNLDQDDATTFVPLISNGSKRTVDIRDIYIVPNPTSPSYLTITSIDVNNLTDFKSVKTILGAGTNIYASLNNLYVASYDSEIVNGVIKSKTNIIKFALNTGNINMAAFGSVDGYILNQFSMDEYDNTFRIVTTTSEFSSNNDQVVSSIVQNNTKNNIYVLDSNLRTLGQIEDLAEEERVYAVRFDKEIAYFVTFRQVDPLFTVDLSNPRDPRILSELKIPGFSEYLHVYNEDYLFGLGKDANEEGQINGMKISMFNIIDKTNVIEEFKKIVGNQSEWSEASYNHKAILISQDKNLIAFPVGSHYAIYSFQAETGFTELIKIALSHKNYGNLRGLYIEDYLYVVDNLQIASYSLLDFTKIDNLFFEAQIKKPE